MARWIARTLASLAVLAACSFGAATLPVGGAATAPVASSVVAPVEGLTLPPGAAGRHLSDVAPVDHQAVPVGGSEPVAAPRAVTRPADHPVVLAGLVPATVGSRAPPAR
ncbi:hypothetical protein [Micromonospora chersina]|uniref:hypothetical protein n=1 Tax=Micromonospora chersina TaxID=47854 RepID=UPI003720F8B7